MRQVPFCLSNLAGSFPAPWLQGIDMELNKSPAFQFYPAEFLADENVALMSNQQLGCYMKLMCYCWREGSIPSEIAKIARLCGEDHHVMAELWLAISSCFSKAMEDANRLIHPRLEKERIKQLEYKIERAQSGKKGAKARWDKASNEDSSAIAKPKAKPMAKNGSLSSSLSSSSSNKTINYDDYPEFLEFWSIYPNKDGKKKALEAWINHKPPIQLVMQALEWQTKLEKWLKEDGKYVPMPTTYINGARWESEPPKEVTF